MAELTHIEDGKAAVYKREGTFYARIRIDGKYVHRTLKTGDLAVAIKAAQKLVHKFEFSVEHGIPIDAKTVYWSILRLSWMPDRQVPPIA